MSDAFRVIYTADALDDLRAIYSYIAFRLKERRTAALLIKRLRKEIRDLNHLPARYPLVEWEPWHSMAMHQMSVENYLIYYVVSEDSHEVTVAHVYYAGRDIQTML